MFSSSPSPFLNGERPEANAWGNGSLCVKKIKEGGRLQPPMSSKLQRLHGSQSRPSPYFRERVVFSWGFRGFSWMVAWASIVLVVQEREPQQALKNRKTVSCYRGAEVGKEF
ncbi:hypothetical protein FOIG_14174 [Fusarium odoratissimum NRRL 54006]|uniref:Uncharacterized protein n=2 Tax=Fusarium oxysporum species complex TaxID=171631 RepID=X0IUU3_FUSO5|nr:uncharacterized protein FOIG_14174 [Fusarium odoratissimum NRRL 54006]EXL92682.1 hypothetical protein FOIG_14174 [Fusarium odoratissimum NRRL 54006]TXC02593.1 hypothetical protein FocTR4_00015320 [Fusarium oxysporum f. sp. cubense]